MTITPVTISQNIPPIIKKLTQTNLFFVVGITTILILTYSMIFIFRHIFIEDYDLIYPSKLYPWILVVPQIFMLVFSIIYLKNLRQLFLNDQGFRILRKKHILKRLHYKYSKNCSQRLFRFYPLPTDILTILNKTKKFYYG